MNKNLKEMAEKSLKSFLKKKKIGFTNALLTAFLITGGIGLASSAELAVQAQSSQEALLSNIQAQKAEIEALIKENETALREARLNQDELIRKGDFYSKAVYPSTQIFLSYGYDRSGKGKDNTKSEWGNTIDAITHRMNGATLAKGINPYGAGEVLAGYTISLNDVHERYLDPNIDGNFGVYSAGGMSRSVMDLGGSVPTNPMDALLGGNGVYIDQSPYVASIELGANISPLSPVLPTVDKTVSVTVGTPNLTGIPNPTVPVVTPPTAPSAVVAPSITVSAPSAVGTITIASPLAPTPNVPGDKTIAVPTVTTPTAVEPTMVVAPQAPALPNVPTIVIPTVTITAQTTGTGDNAWIYNPTGDLGVINQINITSGTFTATSDTSGLGITGINITNYAGNPTTTNGTGTYTSSAGTHSDVVNGTGTSSVGFYKWCGAPYISFGEMATINWIGGGVRSRALLKNDVHGNQAQTLDTLLAGSSTETITADEGNFVQNAIYPYHNHSGGTNGSSATTALMYGINYGTWNISGDYVNGYEADGHYESGTNRATVFNNAGTIQTLAGSSRIALAAYGHENSGNRTFTTVNGYDDGSNNIKGEMILNGTTSVIFYTNRSGTNHEIDFLNYGTLIINGGNNAGLFLSGSSNASSSIYMENPLEIYGDSNLGVYFQSSGYQLDSSNSEIRVNIGVNQDGSNTSVPENATATGNNILAFQNAGIIDNNVGIYATSAYTLSTHELKIGDETKSNIGMYAGQTSGTFNLGNGSIILYGGTENIGLYTGSGNIISAGSIEFGAGSGNGNIGAYSTGGHSISVADAKASGTSTNGILLYANNGAITITNDVAATGMTVIGAVSSNQNNSMLAFATNSGTVTLNNVIIGTSANPDIEITGMAATDDPSLYRGIGLMADGGTVTANAPLYIKVTDGAAGVASIGLGGSVVLDAGSTIEVDNGYAAYSDGTGAINLTGVNIILDGTATAFDWDLGGWNPLILSGTMITVNSDDVIVFNMLNPGIIATSAIGGLTPAGVTVNSGTAFNYIEAAVEGATVNIDSNIDKASTSGNDFYFYNRFIAQNSILNVNTGFEAKAELSSAQATAYKNQVIALEMNASRNAISNATSQINNNGTITAARTDAGNGAVGAFINYGRLTNSGIIRIQDGYTSNVGGTGIYATNGSLVTNSAGGNIDTYGNEGLGIYGTAWRELSDGTLAINEFGTLALNQGETHVINAGNITTHGADSVGIYMDNNSAGTPVAISATNTGTITIGEDSIGIYASGNGTFSDTTIDNTGTLVIGKNSAGIYGTNAVNILNIGNLVLGEDSIGVILEPGSTAPGAIGSITESTPLGDKVVITINGPASGAPVPTTLGLPATPMSLSGTTGVTALYAQGVTGATNNSTNLQLGTNGVGIYVKNGDGTNAGTISMGASDTGSVGMYTSDGTIINTGTINVGHQSQIGMAVSGAGGAVSNNGAINLNVTGTTGIYASNGATVAVTAGGTINFAAANSFGVVADNSTINISVPGLTLNNSDEGIYIYAKNNSTINVSSPFVMDGVLASATQRSIGIYLDGTNTLANTASIMADNGAIGIYSTGATTLSGGVYASRGDRSIGVYFANGGTLAGGATVEAGGAPSGGSSVGVYGAAGAINVSGSLGLNLSTPLTSGGIGTGIYLSDGASITGDKININNNSSTITNIGIYYNGAAGNAATHGTDVELVAASNKVVGLFVNGGMDLTNGKDIVDNTVQDSVAVLIDGGSKYVGSGTLTGAGSVGGDTIGYYVNDGTAENHGTINLVGTGANSVAMAAETGSGVTATIKNSGTINADASVGLLLDGTLGIVNGENSGTISVGATGTGVYLTGSGTVFNGAGGTINVSGASGVTAAGIALDGIGAGQVTNGGTINLGADGVGVFADNGSAVDFSLTLTGNDGTGVYARVGSTVTGTIDGSAGQDVVSVYLADGTSSANGAQILTGQMGSSTSIGLFLGGANQTYTMNSGSVTASNAGTLGIHLDNGNVLNYATGMTVNAGKDAVGIYAEGTGTTVNTLGGTLNITDTGIGLYVRNGATANIGTTGALDVNFSGTGGVLTFNDGGTVNLGNQINILSGSGTLAATANGNLSNSGTMNVGTGSVGLLGIYNTPGVYSISNIAPGTINVTGGGAGLAATGTGATVTVTNNGIVTVDGVDSVGIYTDIGAVNNGGGTITVTNSGVGIYVEGTGDITDFGTINVTEGVGYVSNGVAPTGSVGTVVLGPGTASQYSIGEYLIDVNGVVAGANIVSSSTSNYSIGTVVEGTGAGALTVLPFNMSTGLAGQTNSIGMVAKGDVTLVSGDIIVSGDNNIGLYSDGTAAGAPFISLGDILVDQSTATTGMTDSSIGAYMNAGGQLHLAGTLEVGDNSIGAFGKGADITVAGLLDVYLDAVGIYGENGGTLTASGGLDIGNGSLGVYGKGGVNIVASGPMQIWNDLGVGIVSEGNGNVSYSGVMTIDPITAISDPDYTGSIGIYKKNGTGTITTSGLYAIGDGGYAIYGDNLGSTSAMTINNSASMILGETSVGIYAGGTVIVNNTGAITTGETWLGPNNDHDDKDNHLNSVGIFGESGALITNGVGGLITSNNDHSLGVYVSNSTFINDGTIMVDAGGVGVLGVAGSVITNNGLIETGYTLAPCGQLSVGIGAYNGTEITNSPTGVITVGEGVGIYLATATKFTNYGTLNIDNGSGISGDGTYINHGTVVITDLDGNGATGAVKTSSSGTDPMNHGAITISKDGTVLVNNQFVNSGTLVAHRVESDGMVINVLDRNGGYLFEVNEIAGTIRVDSNLITTGNGYAWTVSNVFDVTKLSGAGELEITMSPLFMADFTNNLDIQIVKQPYAYLVAGSQFDNLYNGIDSLLGQDQDGLGNDSTLLKGLNRYLDDIYNNYGQSSFESETSRTLAEMRGDVYATTQQRMNNIQGAFDNAFNELVESHNFTRDTGKYSVIYQQGDYKDGTLGIDDYDYKVTGLLYMKDYEGRKYGNKWGYSLGFAVSRFDFDDAPTFGDDSKEDVYSLRAGIHNVHTFDEDDTWNLRTRLEVGYNRHKTERTLELDRTYKNEGKFDSYNVTLDNRLSKTVFRNLRTELKLYGDLNLEYGNIAGFTEKSKGDSALELKLAQRDYYSMEGALGVQGSSRVYLGKKITAKLTGDLAYGYEFGNSHNKRVKARVDGGTEGWYNLIRPEEEQGHFKGVVGLTLEKANSLGVTLELDARKYDNKDDADLRYGLRFNYKFMN